MSAINKNNLHRPPKSQAVADVQPRAGRFVFHTLSVVVMINGFLALKKMAFSKHIAPQYGGECLAYIIVLTLAEILHRFLAVFDHTGVRTVASHRFCEIQADLDSSLLGSGLAFSVAALSDILPAIPSEFHGKDSRSIVLM